MFMGVVASVTTPSTWGGESMAHWGSFVVQGIPAIGLILAGSYRRTGWLICLMGQMVAVTYGLATDQLGFVAWAPIYLGIYGLNWLRWSKDKERGNCHAGTACDLRHRRDCCADA
jgi:hypothetical protein